MIGASEKQMGASPWMLPYFPRRNQAKRRKVRQSRRLMRGYVNQGMMENQQRCHHCR